MNDNPETDSARDVMEFLLNFSTTLITSGAQSSRTLRNISRFSTALGYTVHTIILPRTIIMTIEEKSEPRSTITEVRKIPHGALNFAVISRLRVLSWQACTNSLSLAECKRRYEEIKAAPRISGLPLILIASCGNAAFCQLFGGWYSIPIVFAGTFLGFSMRCILLSKHVPALITFFVSAFVASFSTAVIAQYFNFTTNVALTTSVLFLIPGIPLMTSIIDIMDGHVLSGLARFINASLLVMALTLGLVVTIVTLGIHL